MKLQDCPLVLIATSLTIARLRLLSMLAAWALFQLLTMMNRFLPCARAAQLFQLYPQVDLLLQLLPERPFQRLHYQLSAPVLNAPSFSFRNKLIPVKICSSEVELTQQFDHLAPISLPRAQFHSRFQFNMQ